MIEKQRKLESKAEGSRNNRNKKRRKQKAIMKNKQQTNINFFQDCPNLVPIVRNITIKKKKKT